MLFKMKLIDLILRANYRFVDIILEKLKNVKDLCAFRQIT